GGAVAWRALACKGGTPKPGGHREPAQPCPPPPALARQSGQAPPHPPPKAAPAPRPAAPRARNKIDAVIQRPDVMALSKPRHRFAKCSNEQCDCNACDGRPNDVRESPCPDVQHRSSSPESPEYFPSQRHETRGEIGAPRPTLNLGFPPHAG